MRIELSEDELDLVTEALTLCASRRESQAKAAPGTRSADSNGLIAAQMRKLRTKLLFIVAAL
jgi:hypothetical protein